ncbi:hypothetical protein IDG47_13195 [Staphylococcus sp. EG-SA-6]|uniref:hypothetical protein n=1 Tax=Staphylococcus haemolyticus TaxID=1283 RepID=UPI00069ED2AB|nr:hypothetical protein [Staphylococcus haemolyticus]MBN4933690.1 hypothetical protein [Staphylococcus sp. EG-SA-6]MBK3939958.1 hypothetical protein [Staphylococcus haemolyticus]MBK3940025.1 hypothetical protein [Staphylococcus haemolyticus]MCH4520162.1 hypothetical protein [Staphylococcus haemolyticus]MDN7229588.1 hypothetical protein [Staphylococcus haemolyticus]
MAKIKRKVEMTLPELIEWGWENEVSDKAFYSNLDGGSVYFDKIQNLSIEHEIAINETFTVEIEEEIDEDTVFPVLVKTLKNVVEETKVVTYYNASIEFSKSKNETISYHILNDDGTMTLIWKDGAMVE